MFLWLLAFLYVTLSGAATSSRFAPARPPAIPLAVRSPYLSTWLHGDSKGVLPGTWPRFWTGQISGWQGFVAVDGTPYNWMGAAPGAPPVTQVAFEYTSTKSIFTFDVAGKVTMTVTFLSPVYADDLVLQSLQFSYIDVKVKSADGGSHRVQVYMDITGEVASADRSKVIKWDFGTADDIAFHQFYLDQQNVFQESGDQANWGTWHLSTSAGDGMTHKSGGADDVRKAFISNGRLDNGRDSNFRAISDNWPVFALAKDLGLVSGDEKDVLFTVGISQDQVVKYLGADPEPIALTGHWKSKWGSPIESVRAFFQGFGDASAKSTQLDAKIQSDAVAAGGQDYATITTLSVRQAFAALQVAQGPRQTYVFLKEISSNGDSQTVDVIFPAHPVYLYLNPSLLKLLLDPLYENQESGHYPNAWAIHDLGVFPNAVGYRDGKDEWMPLEECGNMAIMTLAYAQRTGDTAYLSKHWDILDRWGQYLIDEALIPDSQLSTDDFAGPLHNQTNLAIKGIIALKAMSQIAQLTSHTDRYGPIADDYLRQWKGFGINAAAQPPHTTLNYGNDSSHGLLYNLFADRLLGLGFVDQAVYDMQSAFYPTVALDFGVPNDTRHRWAKTDWALFCAAVASRETRDMFHRLIVRWINETPITYPFTDIYDAGTGGIEDSPQFKARPVMGGSFALMVLKARKS